MRIIDININEQGKALYRKDGGGNEWRELGEKGKEQVLTEAEILELSELIVKIENHYGFPCDIEWAFEDGKFYIVQSRPITTLSSAKEMSDNKKHFVKFWTTPYSIPNLCMFGKQYTSVAQTVLGTSFNEVYFVYEKGKATVYRDEMENDSFAKSVASSFKDSPTALNIFIDKTLHLHKELLHMFDTKDNIFTLDFFTNFKAAYDLFLPHFIGLAWAAEAVDKESKPELFDALEKTRKSIENFYSQSEIFLSRYYRRIQEGLKLNSPELIHSISEEELLKFIVHGKLPNIADLKERDAFTVLRADYENTVFFTGEQARKIYQELLVTENTHLNEIRGNSAYKGYAKGRIKIIFYPSDLEHIENGDVLVTVMTRPEWLVGIQKASAIVTDVGGTLSHAAIVARELKKPCIIGTKIATQVLHDGDLVEVDADNGVVRMIERAKDGSVFTSLFHEAEWEHYLTRPFTLFGASLWQGWYGSEASFNLFGVQMKNALFVEQAEGVARNYRIKKELAHFGERMKSLLEKDEEKAKLLFGEALEFNAEAEKYLLGEKEFSDFSSATDFLVNLALRATVLPFWVLHFSTVIKYDDENLVGLAEKLRGVSHYPNLVSKIVTPLAEKILEEKGEDKKYTNFLTVSELLSGNVEPVEQRKKQEEKGKRFLYEVFDGEEKVNFVDDAPAVIGALEHVPVLSGEVRGQTAYKGKVIGTARVVYGIVKNTIFNKGDILISINSNPSLMPLLEKCGGIVTDEGGIMCHAAIIAREMEKPCVIGTKFATSLIKDGDLVEVDADSGMVWVLERAFFGGDLCDRYLELIGERKLYPPLNGYSVFLQGSEYNIQKYYKKWYDDTVKLDLFIHIKEGYSQVWVPEDDLKVASEFGFREYLNDPAFFERRGEYMTESIKKIDSLYREYTYEKINGADWETLFALVNEVRDIMWDVNAAVVFSIYLDKQLCIDILEKENRAISPEKLNILWEKAIEPAFESFDKAQFGYFLELMKEGAPWNEIVERCQYFLTDYYSARTLIEVEKALREKYARIDSSDAAAEVLQSETEEIRRGISTHEIWLESLPENERVIAYYLQTVMKIRDRRKNFFAKGMTLVYRIAEKMFAEAEIDRNLIPYYTVRELLKGTEHLRSSAGNLSDRKNGFQWLVPYEGEVRGMSILIDSGVEKINTYFRNCHSSKEEMSGVLKGQSGYKGVVTGRVRVVLKINSDHGFIDGEILVARMTRPEYVPLMKKASAIITDEGGITCHAAIVSRELKKPCIIGTKIATQVLHDGDLVEVDADNGNVRILERALLK